MTPRSRTGKGNGSHDGGNGGKSDRRTGVDRRISDSTDYTGPDRRKVQRRRPARQPDRPIKR